MRIDRRTFTKSLALAAGALALPSWPVKAFAARLPVNRVTKIRCYYPPNYQSNGPQAFPQSNMVVLVDTDCASPPDRPCRRLKPIKQKSKATREEFETNQNHSCR